MTQTTTEAGLAETETYIVTLPISGVEADIAGMPAEWLERAVRAVGRPSRALSQSPAPEGGVGQPVLHFIVGKFSEDAWH